MGDINNSSHVDVIDLLTLADSWGRTIGNAGYDPTCDLNGDFSVNLLGPANAGEHLGTIESCWAGTIRRPCLTDRWCDVSIGKHAKAGPFDRCYGPTLCCNKTSGNKSP